MITWIKTHKLIVGLSALGLIIVGTVVAKSGNGKHEIVAAAYNDLQQTVAVTGRVEPPREANLGFETSGTVARIDVRVGDQVKTGQTLMTLANADLVAALAVAQQNLLQLQRGSRPEARSIVEAQTAEAQVALDTATTQLLTTLHDSYRRADNALRNQVDRFFNINDTGAVLRINLSDDQLEIKTSHYRSLATQTMTTWQQTLTNLDTGQVAQTLTIGKNTLQMVQVFTDIFTAGLNDMSGEAIALDTTINGVRTIVAEARTNIDTALTNIITAEKNYLQARSAFAVAEQKLALETLGGDPAEIAVAQARVREAEARLAKTIIRAPFTGRVAKQSASLGEVTSINTPLVSIIGDGLFEVEAVVPEAEIAKIILGQPAQITLDAYPSTMTFTATVTQTDLTETVKDGVAAYGLRLQFTEPDTRLKSGLTANVTIATGAKTNVLTLPARAVRKENNTELVTVIKNNKEVEVEIVTGLRGDDGLIEVISGVSEGDQVIVS